MSITTMQKKLAIFVLALILALIIPANSIFARPKRPAPRRPSRNVTRSKARANYPRPSKKRTTRPPKSARPRKSAKRTKRPPTYGSIRYSSSKKPYRSHSQKIKRNARYYNMTKTQNRRNIQYNKAQRQQTVSANRNVYRKKNIGKASQNKRQRQARKNSAAKIRARNINKNNSKTPEQIKNRRKAIIGAAAAAGGAAAVKNRKQKRELNKEQIREKIKNKGNAHVGGWKSRRKYLDKIPAKYKYLKHKGRPYYRHKFWWYRPCWRGDDIVYEPCYPPIGYYYPILPNDYDTVVIHEKTYYRDDDDVYYAESEQDGKKGYVVVEPPTDIEGQAVAESEETQSQQEQTQALASETEQAKQQEESSPADATQPTEEQQQQQQIQLASAENSPETTKALNILKQMCEFVAKQKKFTFSATNTLDKISDSGEKTQTITHQTFYVDRADGQKLACKIKGKEKNRYFLYDGQKIILYDKDKNVYASINAPDTIDEMLDMIIAKYGVNLPLIDILFDDPFLAMSAEIKSGKYLGTEKIGNTKCSHLKFEQDEIDWEIWIEATDKPLPRKVVITYKNIEGKPRFVGILDNWNLSPNFSKNNPFDFKPPANAEKIEIEPIDNSNL